MAFIAIEFGGKKTFGGYLSVDGDKQMVLSEALLIKVPAGMHNLEFMNVPKANRTIMNANAMAGNFNTAYYMADSMVEGTITEELGENDLLTLIVVSGDNGQILDVPSYRITTLDNVGMEKLEVMYQEQVKEGIQSDGSNVKTEFWICLFLGWLGIHKYYRGKVLMGLIYTFTFGIAGIGWVIDTIRLLIKVLKLKKAQ